MVVGLFGKNIKTLFKPGKIFVIAEIANSHEGNLSKAKNLIESAADSGADAVKFQKFFADELVEKNHEKYNLFKKLEFKKNEWAKLISFAKSKNLKIFVDVFGIKSAKQVSKYSIDGYKIHSSDVTNPLLLEFLAKKKKSILLSVAGAKLNEIDEALKILLKVPKEIAILYGFQGYPTRISDINLGNMHELRKRYGLTFGISDHVSGDSKMAKIVPLLGISLGARVIEKHITLDRSKKGIDHQSALNPDEFKEFISLVKQSYKCLKSNKFQLSKNELIYRKQHKKNTISKTYLKKGQILNEKMFKFKRTKNKTESIPYFDFIGRTLSKNLSKGTVLTKSHINKKALKIVAVLACRVESKRLFAKPLQTIGNYTILELLIAQLKTSSMVDDIVLAISENPRNGLFVNFAKDHRLKFIEGDDTDVLKRLIIAADYVNADTVLRVTSENPFIYWEGMADIIKKHEKGNFDLTTFKNLPLGSSIEIIRLKALKVSHKNGTKRHHSELCTLYINENPRKFKICRLEPEKEVSRPDLRLTVDTPQDLWVSRIIHKSLGSKDKPIHLNRIVDFLDSNSNVKKINSDIPVEFRIF